MQNFNPQLFNQLINNLNNSQGVPTEYLDNRLNQILAYDYSPENWRNWNNVRIQEMEDWYKQHHPIQGYFKYDAPFPLNIVDTARVEFENLKKNHLHLNDQGK